MEIRKKKSRFDRRICEQADRCAHRKPIQIVTWFSKWNRLRCDKSHFHLRCNLFEILKCWSIVYLVELATHVLSLASNNISTAHTMRILCIIFIVVCVGQHIVNAVASDVAVSSMSIYSYFYFFILFGNLLIRRRWSMRFVKHVNASRKKCFSIAPNWVCSNCSMTALGRRSLPATIQWHWQLSSKCSSIHFRCRFFIDKKFSRANSSSTMDESFYVFYLISYN